MFEPITQFDTTSKPCATLSVFTQSARKETDLDNPSGSFVIHGELMAVNTDEPVTIAELDEALGHLCDTLHRVPDQAKFMGIVDELLDKRLEMTKC